MRFCKRKKKESSLIVPLVCLTVVSIGIQLDQLSWLIIAIKEGYTKFLWSPIKIYPFLSISFSFSYSLFSFFSICLFFILPLFLCILSLLLCIFFFIDCKYSAAKVKHKVFSFYVLYFDIRWISIRYLFFLSFSLSLLFLLLCIIFLTVKLA